MAPSKKKTSKKKAPVKKKVAKKPTQNKKKTTKKKGVKGFQKGKSGNPGGRPKKRKDLEALCQESTEEDVKILNSIITSKKEKSKDRLLALKLKWEYGYGKPTVYVTTPEDEPLHISGGEDLLAALSSMAE